MMDIEERPGNHRWIHYYEPPPDVVCFKFPVLSWANGCPYSCAYCYLRQTLWRQKSKMVVWNDHEIMQRQIKNWLKKRKKVELLNAGELADSMTIEGYSGQMFRHALEALAGAEGLYLLTKSGGQRLMAWGNEGLDWSVHVGINVVVGFSINANPVALRWEGGAPFPHARLGAARLFRNHGWRVRIRIDPMIPLRGWQAEYEKVAKAVNLIKPERVTLGSLRANSGLRAKLPPDLRGYLSDDYVGGKYRIAPGLRSEMYRFVGERLETPFSLCKETKEIWQESGAKGRCVCLP